jgi:glycosyltransferase involved in cell wall biosynthesis
MRIGIYNRHLSGVGGGEKHMLAMAEILSQHHAVDVITHQLLDLRTAGARLGVDLERVRLRAIEHRPEPELAPITADYDLFINASDGTFLPSRAPRSVLLVYFPTPLRATPWVRLKWRLGHLIRRVLMVPQYASGFYGPQRWEAMTVRWLCRHARVDVPTWPWESQVGLRLYLTSDRPVEGLRLSARSQPVAQVSVPARRMAAVDVRVPVVAGGPAQLDITLPDAGCAVAIADVEVVTRRHRLYRLMFRRWLREWGQRLEALYPTLDLSHLDTYDTICANSRYTQGWIRRYWDRDSVVFYPPVDVDLFEPRPKEQQILSVGRFFTTGHNKKHLAMIRAFREMLAHGLTGWELHLAGGASLGDLNAAYLADVQAAARGAPIHVHTDVSFDALRQLYGASAIYWHAAGLGADPERDPVRYEHFGLTTVEAMAAGAVPVVIDGGGQREIVTHGSDGFLWSSTEELRALTRELIADPQRRAAMAAAARARSQAFGREAFAARLWEIVGSRR